MKSKLILLVVQLAFVSTIAHAQTPPRDGLQLRLSVAEISLTRGETDSVELSVLRSRAHKKGAPAYGVSSPKMDGIEVRMQWTPDIPDTCLYIISARAAAKPGIYNILTSCALNNRKYSAILKVTVQ